MKKAIEQEDWVEVKRILQQHNRSLEKDAPIVKHEISNITNQIARYGEDLDQISRMLQSQIKRRDAKNDMLLKVESAISQAHFFEETILHLIQERKFMK